MCRPTLLLVSCYLLLCSCATWSKSGSNEKSAPPKLSQARYRTIWVPDKIEGDRYIEGHRVHIIEEAGRWMSE